ncbi:PIF1-like helicase [Senna tora]|uniref:PIF1-like helicase n=1 Tax=Senna tora TaxID=362788 RepID=A0A834TTL2_9FABA|nr:PIF1-like helicase [Senna tora]
MDDLTTLDMKKSKQQLRGDGRRLSFPDVEASLTKETPSTCKRSVTDLSDDDIYNTEFLNTINGSGLPYHQLRLKVGAPIILLRNIDKSMGCCGGPLELPDDEGCEMGDEHNGTYGKVFD